MGFSDIGCYGSEIPTPNLDALARTACASPSSTTRRAAVPRAPLLTGLYPHQTGVGHMTDDKGVPGYQGRLNDSCVTIAEVLKPAGYFTAMTGKWHVGQKHGVNAVGPRLRAQSERGGRRLLLSGIGSKAKLFLNGQEIADDDPRLPKDWYSTDLWTTFGLKFIDEALRGEEAVLPASLPQRAALPAASARRGDREVSRQIPGRLGRAP